MTYPPGQHGLPHQSHGQPNHHQYDQQSQPQQPPGWQPPPPQQPPGWQAAPPPPQQQYGWQPAPPPSPQPANKGGKAGGAVGTILAIVAAVWLIGQAGSDSNSSSPGPGQDTAAVDDASTDSSGPAPKGSAVRDGKFEFTARKVDCGKRRIGSEYLDKRAQGQFCLVHVKVANIGSEPQLFDDSNQKALDASGNEYAADTEAGIYLENSEAFLNEINPGNSVNGILVFDVPKGTKLTAMEFHDSPFSGGAQVSLR